MAIQIDIDIQKSFEVTCDFDKVFDVLADVPLSVSHFPKIEQLVPLGDEAYRWEMEKIGKGKYHIQTVYACRYTSDRDKGSVEWEPVPNVGNGVVRGLWDIQEKDGKTVVKIETKGTLTMPFPRIAKPIIAPVVRLEFNNLINKYIENLTNTFES